MCHHRVHAQESSLETSLTWKHRCVGRQSRGNARHLGLEAVSPAYLEGLPTETTTYSSSRVSPAR